MSGHCDGCGCVESCLCAEFAADAIRASLYRLASNLAVAGGLCSAFWLGHRAFPCDDYDPEEFVWFPGCCDSPDGFAMLERKRRAAMNGDVCECDFCTGAKKREDNWCARCGLVRLEPPAHWENLDVCGLCEEAMAAEPSKRVAVLEAESKGR